MLIVPLDLLNDLALSAVASVSCWQRQYHVLVLPGYQLCRLQITSLDTEPREGIVTFLGRKPHTEIFYSLTLLFLQMCRYLTEAAKWRTSVMEAVPVQICCWPQKVCSVRACVSSHPNQISMEACVRQSTRWPCISVGKQKKWWELILITQ